jgi:hypothetical protein
MIQLLRFELRYRLDYQYVPQYPSEEGFKRKYQMSLKSPRDEMDVFLIQYGDKKEGHDGNEEGST